MKLWACIVMSAIVHLPILDYHYEPPTVELEIHHGCTCCGRVHEPEYAPDPDEPEAAEPEPQLEVDHRANPRLSREMAIEAAVGTLRGWPTTREVALEAARHGWRPSRGPIGTRGVVRESTSTDLELAGSSVVGGLEYLVVRRFLRYHAHEIARCNHAQLDRVPITTEIRIEFDGRVSFAAARGDDPIAGCVARAIRAIEFPVSSAPTDVAVTLTLRPRVERTLPTYGTTSSDVALFVR